jgi:hypothetical protein
VFKRSKTPREPAPDIVITGEALEFVQRLALDRDISVAQVLAHAIALQKAVIEEQDHGALVVSERRSGELLEFIPV